MLIELSVAAMQGIAQALAERLIKGKERSAEIKSLLDEVDALKEFSADTRKQHSELRDLMIRMLSETDGFRVERGRRVIFEPTATTQTPELAVNNLDRAVEQLRLEASANVATSQGPEFTTTVQVDVLVGIEEEIAKLRRRGRRSVQEK